MVTSRVCPPLVLLYTVACLFIPGEESVSSPESGPSSNRLYLIMDGLVIQLPIQWRPFFLESIPRVLSIYFPCISIRLDKINLSSDHISN